MRSLVSTRWEKVASRVWVRTAVKWGESIRSAVSSRRRRRGAGEEGDGVGGMPELERRVSSWSRGGRR